MDLNWPEVVAVAKLRQDFLNVKQLLIDGDPAAEPELLALVEGAMVRFRGISTSIADEVADIVQTLLIQAREEPGSAFALADDEHVGHLLLGVRDAMTVGLVRAKPADY